MLKGQSTLAPQTAAILLVVVVASVLLSVGSSFITTPNNNIKFGRRFGNNRSHDHLVLGAESNDENELQSSLLSASSRIEDCKKTLIEQCKSHELDSGYSSSINTSICNLEALGEDLGFGQASSVSGLLSGKWDLIYASDDITRSSPFFWAFRRAFPDSSDQIFGITDAIPAPVKLVGPATQDIELDASSRGTLVSRVKVATLGGVATSIMTTRASVIGAEGVDGLRLKVETTKPEDSTILKKLGPLGEFVNANAKPFPSGEALERVAPGSSEVSMITTYLDEGLRITRNKDRTDEDVFVWVRVGEFGGGNTASL
jgi:hypothetical protein